MLRGVLVALVCTVFPSFVSLASSAAAPPKKHGNKFIFNSLKKRSQTLTDIFALNSSSAQKNGWLGADADTSIFLNQTTSLWLFGDTLFGGFDARTNTRLCKPGGAAPWTMGCGFTHSTIGVLTQTSSLKKNERVMYEMEFFVNRSKATGEPVPFFQPPNASSPAYWWVVSGVASYTHQDIVLMAQVIAPSPAVCGLGFAVDGTALISIENVADPPLNWTYGSLQLPGTGPCTNWFVGMAHADGKDSDQVYIVGTHGDTSYDANGCAVCNHSSVVLARANITQLRTLRWDGTVEFWCETSASSAATVSGDAQPPPPSSWSSWFASSSSSFSSSSSSSSGGTWSPTCTSEDLRPLFTPTDCGAPNCAISEMSLTYNFYLGRWYAFVVNGFGPEIAFWFSESSDVTGTWASQSVYTIGPPQTDPGCFSYAAKAHPGLQLLGDEVVFSFATNTFNVSQLAEPGMASLYTPQFVSMQVAYASSLVIILVSALLSAFVLGGATIAVVFIVRLRQQWTAKTVANSAYAPLN